MSRQRKIIISILIIFNITAALVAPIRPRNLQSPIEKFFYPYALWTRILQEWSLFSPNPRKEYVYYKFVITFKDGKKKTWVRPYPENWNFFQRHLAYNWQKLDLAGHNLDRNVLYKDFADYLKKKFWDETNPPQMIELYRAESKWSDPKPEGYVGPDLENMFWRDVQLFVYNVGEDKFLRGL